MNKHVAAVLGVIMLSTCTSSAPVLAQTKEDASIIINFCQVAYRKFQQGDTAFLRDNMNKLDKDSQAVVALACSAYGTGVTDGAKRKGLNHA